MHHLCYCSCYKVIGFYYVLISPFYQFWPRFHLSHTYCLGQVQSQVSQMKISVAVLPPLLEIASVALPQVMPLVLQLHFCYSNFSLHTLAWNWMDGNTVWSHLLLALFKFISLVINIGCYWSLLFFAHEQFCLLCRNRSKSLALMIIVVRPRSCSIQWYESNLNFSIVTLGRY
jgi:hypothetical protein